MNIMIANRQAGKTTAAIRWVKEGQRWVGYPGWDRVLVVPTHQMLKHLRTRLWGEIVDFDHRIYDWDTWQHAHGASPDTQVVIDNAEWIFPQIPGRLVGITMTGQEWR